MKLKFLENFEERFYFRTSHLFWHLLTGLSGLALVLGILIFLWGLTPSFKPGVKKPKYPKPIKVEVAEIMQQILPPGQKVEISSKMPEKQSEPVTSKVGSDEKDETEVAFRAAIDRLKSLLPASKFHWKTRGHWEET